MITRETVEAIAHLARLELQESEKNTYTEQLNRILEYMEKLNELDTAQIEATSHAVETSNPMREDVVQTSKAIEKILEISPDAEDHFFRVPKVI